MKNNTEKLVDEYIKQIKGSMDYLSKAEIEERISTIKSHILDALEDQKGQLPDEAIIKKAIDDLGIELKPKRAVLNVIADFVCFTVVGLFILLLDWVYIFPTFKYNASIPYFVIVFPAAICVAIWNFTIQDKLPDARYNLILAWAFYPILILELLFLNFPILTPDQPDLVPFLGIMVYGILLTLITILSIVIPNEILEKKCPHCKEILPKKAKFCLMCGEELE